MSRLALVLVGAVIGFAVAVVPLIRECLEQIGCVPDDEVDE